MRCMIYRSKYEAVAVPGRVVVEECSLDLIFFIRGILPQNALMRDSNGKCIELLRGRGTTVAT